jgi:hypothetical protein
LNDHISSIDNSPKLFPDFDIFFIRRDLDLSIFLFNESKRSSPIEIGFGFFLLKLVFGEVFPIRSSGKLKFMQKFLVDQLFNEEVFFLLGGDYFFVSHFLSDFAELNVSVGVEILLTKLCNLEETFQRVLGYD